MLLFWFRSLCFENACTRCAVSLYTVWSSHLALALYARPTVISDAHIHTTDRWQANTYNTTQCSHSATCVCIYICIRGGPATAEPFPNSQTHVKKQNQNKKKKWWKQLSDRNSWLRANKQRFGMPECVLFVYLSGVCALCIHCNHAN